MFRSSSVGLPSTGSRLWFDAELHFPETAGTDAEPFPGHQSANAQTRVRTSEPPVSLRVRHHRDSTYAAHLAADELRQAHRAKALLLLSRRGGYSRSCWHKHTYVIPLMIVLQILDEVYRVLHYIRVTPKLAKPYKVTDELFDLSTMAMEYFKEHIEPTLPEIPYFGADFLDLAGTFCK